jgi:hypothetical protein
MNRMRRFAVGLLILTLLACGATPPSEPSPSPAATPTVEPGTGPTPSPHSTPTASPAPAPTASPDAGRPASPPASPPPSPAGPTAPATPAETPAPVVSPTAAPVGPGWSGPERVSERSYYEPSLIMTGGLTDIAHVAAGLDGRIFYVTNDAGNIAGAWTRERLSSPPRDSSDEQTSIALDASSGDMYIAFTRLYDSELGTYPEGIYLLRRPYGSDWSDPALLVGEGAHSPSLRARDGHIYLAYVAGAPLDIIEDDPHFPVMYGTDGGGAFAAEEVSRNGDAPQLELGSDGRPHILFGSPFWADVGVQYAVGTGPSGSFSVERLPGTTEEARRPSLALDSTNRPHAAWSLWPDAGEPTVQYASRGAGGWSTGLHLFDNVMASGIVVDGMDSVHVVAGGEGGVWYATDQGGSFETQRLSREPALWLDLAPPEEGTPRQVHMVFVSGSDGRGNGLWYGVGRVE